MALGGEKIWRETDQVTFPQWKEALGSADLPASIKATHQQAIFGFLRHCKQRRTPASVAVVKQYLAAMAPSQLAPARQALRWFFQESRRPTSPPVSNSPRSRATRQVLTDQTSSRRRDLPMAAADDLGGADWERDLIMAIRRKGFLWRTEQTYRQWAGRFAQFISPRSPYAAEGADVAAFLGSLAVRHRASRSTQQQALNALVFFMEEALKRALGELDFHRAKPRKKIPTVLTMGECHRLFSHLTDTNRLMGELMYGAGLRLMELLRLRVHHLDLERQQVQIYARKGNKDRLGIVPSV